MPAQSQSPENKFIFHGPCPHHRDTAPTSPLAQVAAEQPLARWPSHRRKKKKRGSGRRPLSLSLDPPPPMAGEEGEDEAASIELQLEHHLQEQRASLTAVDEALAADPSNADLLEVRIRVTSPRLN